MSDNGDQEKTEQPTGKKLGTARDKGQVAMSKEVMAATVFLTGIVSMKMSGDDLFDALAELTTTMFALPVERVNEMSGPTALLTALAGDLGSMITPILVSLFVMVALAGFFQAGVHFTLQPLQPDFNKLNPVKGVKKLFGLDNIVQVTQQLVKLLFVGTVIWFTIVGSLDQIIGLADKDLVHIGSVLAEILFLLAIRVGGGMVFIALIDLMYRRWKHTKDLMMSKQEVKDEGKQAEGDPQIKSKIREVQRKMAIQRMKGDVQEADVVVRNPTHFAVALKYESESPAPRVVAKGRGLMALRIIEIAEEAGVEVVENRPLARNLYRTVRVGDWIPERLFKAVAEVLSYVYKKRGRRPGARSA